MKFLFHAICLLLFSNICFSQDYTSEDISEDRDVLTLRTLEVYSDYVLPSIQDEINKPYVQFGKDEISNAFYVKKALKKLLEGNKVEGLGLLNICSENGNQLAYYVLGRLSIQGYFIPSSYDLADFFFCEAGLSETYLDENNIQAINEREFVQYLQAFHDDLDKWIDNALLSRQMQLNEGWNELFGTNISTSTPQTNSNGNSRSSSRCRYCNGTGINRTAVHENSDRYPGVASHLAHYNPQGTRCSICGKSTKHYHDKCLH